MAFDHLRSEGKVKTQKDVADTMNADPTSISQALNGNERYCSDKFLVRFNSAFDNMFNMAWLMTGRGEMLEDVEANVVDNRVPLIPLSSAGNTLYNITSDGVQLSDCEVVVSPVNNAEFAIGVYGDSMEPTYPSGSRVFIRKIDPGLFIPYGSVFVLDTVNGTYIKEVQRGDDDEHIRCISHNTSGRYPAFDIPIKAIYGMYRVLACITISQ